MATLMSKCTMVNKIWKMRLISTWGMAIAMTPPLHMKHMVQESRKTGKITVFFFFLYSGFIYRFGT